MPRLTRITIYPLKSFDGLRVERSSFAPGGGLRNDRRFALVDAHGNFVNGKRFASLHRLRATFDDGLSTVTLAPDDGAPATFALRAGDADLARWCDARLGTEAALTEDVESGFPDDLQSPGPTLISTATIRRVGRWFDLDDDEVRRRFRANLEIDDEAAGDCPAFWEDRLFAADAAPDAREVVAFRIGDVRIEGVNPCARCAVPTRDSLSGEVRERFAFEFGRRRREELPAWAPPSAFEHCYRLAVNTRVPPSQFGREVRVGDRIVVGEPA